MSKGKTEYTNKLTIGFFKVPNEIFKVSLDPFEFKIYLYLLSNAENWTPSHRAISSATMINRNTVGKILISLENKGYLNVDRTRTRHSYILAQWDQIKKGPNVQKKRKVRHVDKPEPPTRAADHGLLNKPNLAFTIDQIQEDNKNKQK